MFVYNTLWLQALITHLATPDLSRSNRCWDSGKNRRKGNKVEGRERERERERISETQTIIRVISELDVIK